MPACLAPSKIRPDHLARDAWIYVRQSSLTQIRTHTAGVVAASESLHRWRLGFEQSSPRRIARVSQGDAVRVFGRPPLSRHAVVP